MYPQSPLAPQNQQPAEIGGTVGEERGSRNRYHYGLDITAAIGTPAYAIESAIYNNVKGSVAIGHFAYVHVINHPEEWEDNGQTWVNAGDFIGYVGDVTHGHVHLQQSPVDLSLITGFEEQNNIEWVNPIGHINPIDNVKPDIDEVLFFRQGNNNGSNITIVAAKWFWQKSKFAPTPAVVGSYAA